MDKITMNRKERKQLVVFNKLKNNEITRREAALRLKMSKKWVREKLKRYIECGDIGLVHRGRGRSSHKKWNQEEKELAIDLLKSDWKGFGPTFAAEKLKELHGISVSKETLRKIMIEQGLWHSRRKRRTHRKRRERRSMVGLMVQLDGSPHDWFEGRAPSCTLLVFIDDATSRILWLEFVHGESRLEVMRATKNYMKKDGLPHSFYVDFGSVFSVNLNNRERDKKTQWERVMKELLVEVIHAHSPQAKGRVERSNATLQDRLIKEMRLAGISSMEEANQFLTNSDFVAKHNIRFAVSPTESGNAHRPCEINELDQKFCIKEKRILANDFTITYQKRVFQLLRQQKAVIRPKNEIVVKTDLNGIIQLSIRGINLMHKELNKRPDRIIPDKTVRDYIQKPSRNSQLWVGGKWVISEEKLNTRVG